MQSPPPILYDATRTTGLTINWLNFKLIVFGREDKVNNCKWYINGKEYE